jgi:uncharacterized protein (TIGR02118 family)
MAAHLYALYHTPADTAAFDAYYASTHAPLAKKIPGLRSYQISKGHVHSPTGLAPYYLVADLTFDSVQAVQDGLGSPEGAAAAGDLENFATGGVTLIIFESVEA